MNLRDLGGLRTPEGAEVRRGRIYRSASLNELTGADRRALEALGISTVIDLRAEFERSLHPYEWPGVRIVTAPLVHDDEVRSIITRFQDGTLREDELKDWWRLTGVYDAPYEHLPAVKTVFQTLIEADDDDAILYHCRGGKDRTGMVSALVLGALGVSAEDILGDFLASNDALQAEAPGEALTAAVNEALGSALSPEAAFSFAGVRAEWLERLVQGIEEQSGSVEAYLREAVGLGAAGLAALRARYLKPAER